MRTCETTTQADEIQTTTTWDLRPTIRVKECRMKRLLFFVVLCALTLAAPAAFGGLVLGTGCMAMVCNNSHMNLLVKARPSPFVDVAGGAVVTNNSVDQSNATSAFGDFSMLVNAGTDRLTVPSIAKYGYTADFCESVWLNPTTADALYVANQYSAAGNRARRHRTTALGALSAQYFDTGDATFIAAITADGVLTYGAWQKIELCKSGTTFGVYIGGLLVASDLTAGGAIQVPVAIWFMGHSASTQDGYWDEWASSNNGWVWTRNHDPLGRRM